MLSNIYQSIRSYLTSPSTRTAIRSLTPHLSPGTQILFIAYACLTTCTILYLTRHSDASAARSTYAAPPLTAAPFIGHATDGKPNDAVHNNKAEVSMPAVLERVDWPAVEPVYVYSPQGGVEQSFHSSVLLADLYDTCQQRVVHRHISGLYTHLQYVADRLKTDKYFVPSKVLFIWMYEPKNHQLVFEETQVIDWCSHADNRLYCKHNLIHVSLSDEGSNLDIAYYNLFHSVYRNYVRNDIGMDITYLLRELDRAATVDGGQTDLHLRIDWLAAIEVLKEQAVTHGNMNIDDGCPPSYSGPARHDIPEWVKEITMPTHQPQEHDVWQAVINVLNGNVDGNTNYTRRYHQWIHDAPQPSSMSGFTTPVYWLPLGYADAYLPIAAKQSLPPTSERSLLFSWSGSTKDYERPNMHKTLHNTAVGVPVRARGRYTVTDGFFAGDKMLAYTSMLMDSLIVPIPRGNSAEQFRIYESLDAGAFVLVQDRWLPYDRTSYSSLSYLDILGLAPIPLVEWDERFAYMLNHISCLPPRLLDKYQAIIHARYTIVMQTLTKHIANSLCTSS